MAVHAGDKKLKSYVGALPVKWAYVGATKIYSSGNFVTYVVDSGVMYTEEVDNGASVLSPKTFTPSKSGWTFCGWREDGTASGSVLSSKTMGDAPITLYAVFRKSVTLTLRSGGSVYSQTSKDRYYNNGNVSNPAFTVSNPSLSGWTFYGWGTSSTTYTKSYASISGLALDASLTLYAIQYQTITLSYSGNGATSGSMSSRYASRYYNNGNVSDPTFTLEPNGYSRSKYSFSHWSINGSTYYAGNRITLSSSATAYAQWTYDYVTITFVEGGSTTSVEYLKGSTVNRSTAPSGASFVGWSLYSNGSGSLVSSFRPYDSATYYRVIKYNNAVVASSLSKHLYSNDSWAPYALDTGKYSSFDIVASVGFVARMNGTTIDQYAYLWFNGSIARCIRIDTSGNSYESYDYWGGEPLGYGGRAFVMSNLTSLNIYTNGGSSYTTREADIYISSITAYGRQTVG